MFKFFVSENPIVTTKWIGSGFKSRNTRMASSNATKLGLWFGALLKFTVWTIRGLFGKFETYASVVLASTIRCVFFLL